MPPADVLRTSQNAKAGIGTREPIPEISPGASVTRWCAASSLPGRGHVSPQSALQVVPFRLNPPGAAKVPL